MINGDPKYQNTPSTGIKRVQKRMTKWEVDSDNQTLPAGHREENLHVNKQSLKR